MKAMTKRFLAWMLTVLLAMTMLPNAVAEEELEDVLIEEDVEVLDLTISEEMEEAVENLDNWEIDDSVNPDDLELNHDLPDNVVNILLIGIDTRSKEMDGDSGLQHGDVQMILSINSETGSVKLSSILRDLYVEIPGYRNKSRINNAYARGGGTLAMRTINHNFDMNIQHYVTINFFGLASVIDSIGGIDVDLTKREAGAINTYLRKHPPAYDNTDGKSRVELVREDGVQHLDGVQAVMYARLREIDSDFARTARQRHLLDLLLKKIMQDMSLNRLVELINTTLPYVTTNVNGGTVLNLGRAVLSGDIITRAHQGEDLVGQFRIPMDKTYGYSNVNGASVIVLSSKNLKLNVESLHSFIYDDKGVKRLETPIKVQH